MQKGVFSMVNVFRMGYADFATRDIEAMTAYYSDVLGFTLTEHDNNGSAYFSSSTDHHNIALHPSDTSGLTRIGLQLSPSISLKEAENHLRQHGTAPMLKSDARPGVPELLEFEDLDGYIVQLYSSMTITTPGFKRSGIAPNKLGHISVRVKDAKKSVEFYKLLGFVNTDWIEDFFGFMTCNTDHHVLNFCTSPKQGLHHIAFELRDYSHMIGTLDFLGKNQIPILWGPSRHGAGHNIATYHHDPEKNLVELFTDLDVYIRELNCFEPRPWHQNCPQKPQVWDTDACITRWGTVFGTALV
jgi:catechol-2,3-dioxygenase